MTERQSTPSGEPSPLSRRDFVRRSAAGAAGIASFGSLSAFLAACSSGGSSPSKPLPTSLGSGGMSDLISAAKKEGHLNTIALPPAWANYGKIMSTLQSKYSIPITNASPDDSSAQENQAVQTLKGQSRGPDVVDVGPSFAADGKSHGLYTPYKVATWDTIPDSMKDPAGQWYGDYYGVTSFGTNLSVQKSPPKDWPDLTNPRYHGQIAIDGDPRSANDAFSAVYAASLGNGGSLDDIEPGINFFVKLKKMGNFIPADALPANISKGSTPIAIIWDYLNLAYTKQFNSNPQYAVSIPPSGVYGGFYAQAISKYAPHPMAARLWQEFIYSDEGQLLYLAGFTHPARYADLAKRNAIPSALAAQLPSPSAYQNIKFATQAQITAAAKVIGEQWGPKMAG
jgi:putative spermidine/putrescine transport system substrate-binding protein